MKILIATEKPFAASAVNGMKEIAQKAGHEVMLLEKYDSPEKLIKAVADADALIVRSDKVTADVIDAAKNLKIVVRAGAGYDNINLEACTAKNIVYRQRDQREETRHPGVRERRKACRTESEMSRHGGDGLRSVRPC